MLSFEREISEKRAERGVERFINPLELSYYGINTVVSLKDKCLRPKEKGKDNFEYNGTNTGLWAYSSTVPYALQIWPVLESLLWHSSFDKLQTMQPHFKLIDSC